MHSPLPWQAITAFASIVTVISALAAPVDLWRLTVKSHQGEPLLAIVSLTSQPEEHVSTSCLSLGPESDAPGSDMPFLGTANLNLNAARNAVEISSTEPISAPALSLVLRVQCAGAPLYARHFAALIPPAVVKAPAPGTNMTPTIRRGFHLSVARDDSVAGIAAVLFPGQRALQQDLVRQVIAGNPNAFPNRSDRKVPAGTVLWFPDLAGLRQSALSHVRVPSPAPAPVPSAARGDNASHARSPAVRPSVPAKPQPVANVPQTPRAAAPAGSEGKRRERESGVSAMRSKCESFESHLQRIEQSVEALQVAVTAMPVPSPPAAAQCPPVAPAPKPRILTVVITEPIPWTVWLGLPALGMALATALLALRRTGILMRRRATETLEQPDHRPAPQAAAIKAWLPGERTRDAFGPTSYPGPTRPRAASTHAQVVDAHLDNESKASRPDLPEDIIMEMERAIDGSRSIFTDVDRLIGLGRTQNAISVLEFQIKNKPMDRESWIKLMAIYRRAGRQIEFDMIAAEFKTHFPGGGAS